MRSPRLGHAVLPLALFLGVCLSFFVSILMEAQAGTPPTAVTVEPSTLEDENTAEEDDPDANLVPLDTEGPIPEATSPQKTTTSSVPRAEDLLQLNPAGS